MSVFKYIFKTPIATIRKDFKDYEHFNYNLSCTVQDCPYHNFNRAYFDAVQEYNEVRQKRKNFWKQKFSNAK